MCEFIVTAFAIVDVKSSKNMPVNIVEQLTTAVITCDIKLFQNYFSFRRRPSEIILFRAETCLKLFQNYFRGTIAAHEYFPTCSMSLK